MLWFRKIAVARKSMDKRGGYQDFPSIIFCLTMPKSSATESLCVVFQKTSGIEKDFG